MNRCLLHMNSCRLQQICQMNSCQLDPVCQMNSRQLEPVCYLQESLLLKVKTIMLGQRYILHIVVLGSILAGPGTRIFQLNKHNLKMMAID